MSDRPTTSPSLAAISHLFLTDVRERQTRGSGRPVRIPPGAPRPQPQRPAVSIDLTPDEFARGIEAGPTGASDSAGILSGSSHDTIVDPPRRVSVLLAQHLGDAAADRVRQYARHLAVDVGRVGLIEIDDEGLRLTSFDASPLAGEGPGVGPEAEAMDERRLAEAIEEMSWDVDRWLVFPSAPRTPGARALLASARHCVLLSTSDHDGVVAGYRTLKGLSELHRPAMTVVVLDARDEAEADSVYRKLAGVSLQFLKCPLGAEAPVARPAGEAGYGVAEHVVLLCRGDAPADAEAAGPHWSAVGALVANSLTPDIRAAAPVAENCDDNGDEEETDRIKLPADAALTSVDPADAGEPETMSRAPVEPQSAEAAPDPCGTDAALVQNAGSIDCMNEEPAPRTELPSELAEAAAERSSSNAARDYPPAAAPVGVVVSPESSLPNTQNGTPMETPSTADVSPFPDPTKPAPAPAHSADAAEVLDLADASAGAILAVVAKQGMQWVECPVKPPMCASATVAVARDGRLMLLAVSGRGLGELRSIGLAYRWLAENRGLIRMALPQFAVDAAAMPGLRLFVDHADLTADILQPMFQSSNATVQSYRRLRWGQRTGLLLEAA